MTARCAFPESALPGSRDAMTEPLKHAEEKVEEKVEELAHEAEEGATARTPVIVLSGVTIVVAVVVIVVLALAFLAYYLT
jgi:hypothetical protein